MLQQAFKEWAVICQALATGRQAIILRKGGIAEQRGEFKVDHHRFWLYPTYIHQQQEGIKPEAEPLLIESLAQRPPNGIVRLSHFAEVAAVHHLMDDYEASKLAALHLWSDKTVEARFHYRLPGLHVLAVRVYQAKELIDITETPALAGCKSWVELVRPLPTNDSRPVLEEHAFNDVLKKLDLLLEPPAYA
jgi:hypothetical protein